jgi:2-oxoglutarate/2-oxoacid ferredoxin oxidoreductase subunit beta
MKRGEVTIDDRRCFGCGYCVEFCPRGCLERNLDRVSLQGHAVPVFAKPEKCTACKTCARICPRWAIEVTGCPSGEEQGIAREKVASLQIDAPLSGCPGCQHPTVGRIVAEAAADLGLTEKIIALDAIPCAISSAFGMNYGRSLAYEEKGPDAATVVKRSSPDSAVVVVQGYWGLSDFSLDLNSLAGALIRGEKITVIMCNMPFYGPKDGRPVPVTEAVEGRLEPATRITAEAGQKLMVGGYPLHVAELAATFRGVAYSARGAITSLKEYESTKSYVKTAFRKQMDNEGLTLVEVLCVCSDPAYSAPVESLRWVRDRMILEFPLGEYKNSALG